MSSSRTLRVLFALPGMHRVRRGAEVAFESIATELARIPGFDVSVAGTGAVIPERPYRFLPVRCIRRERFEWAPTFPVMRSHYAYEELTWIPGLLRAYSPADYDVTVTCSFPFTNWALRAHAPGRRSPPHVYVTQNGDWPARSRDREFRLFGCDGLVCTNPDYYDRNRDRWRSVLVPNGVDDARFSPGPPCREAFGLPPGVPMALTVSALIASKRVVEGIRCAARVPGLHLVVAGDGELREAVDAAGAEFLGERFHRVTVSHQEMPDLYRSADVLLHPSQDDPSPLAYIEALSTGLPVVAHDCRTTRWTFEDQGFLVDAADDGAVAGAIEQALAARTPEARVRRRELVGRRFTWRRIASAYADFLAEVVAVRS